MFGLDKRWLLAVVMIIGSFGYLLLAVWYREIRSEFLTALAYCVMSVAGGILICTPTWEEKPKSRYERAQARDLDKMETRRAPTNAESTAIAVLARAARLTSPRIAGLWEDRTALYSIASTETVLGAFRAVGRRYNEMEIFLSEDLFERDFARAFATYLHELAHLFGYDGSRDFTDALTHLIEDVVRHRWVVDQLQVRWDAARSVVLDERLPGIVKPTSERNGKLTKPHRRFHGLTCWLEEKPTETAIATDPT